MIWRQPAIWDELLTNCVDPLEDVGLLSACRNHLSSNCPTLPGASVWTISRVHLTLGCVHFSEPSEALVNRPSRNRSALFTCSSPVFLYFQHVSSSATPPTQRALSASFLHRPVGLVAQPNAARRGGTLRCKTQARSAADDSASSSARRQMYRQEGTPQPNATAVDEPTPVSRCWGSYFALP